MFKFEFVVEELYEFLRDWIYSLFIFFWILLSYVCIIILWYVLFVKNNMCGFFILVKYLVVVYFELFIESNCVNCLLICGNKVDIY